jgi:hypothetical protein
MPLPVGVEEFVAGPAFTVGKFGVSTEEQLRKKTTPSRAIRNIFENSCGE